MILSILFLLVTAYLLYRLSVRNYDYWEKKGISFPKPLPFFGNTYELLTLRESVGDFLTKLYNTYSTPYFGIFIFNKPYLVLKSLEIIKLVMVKDFNYFTDRTNVCDENIDSFSSKLLFISKNPQWKFMRSKISQAFSSGRIRKMYPLVNAVAEEMNSYIIKNENKKFIEAKELCSKYAIEVVATCAFGLTGHCFENENAEFTAIGKQLFAVDLMTTIRQMSYFVAHRLVKLFKLHFIDQKSANFIRGIITTTMENRKIQKIQRNDVIDVIIQIINKNSPKDPFRFEGDTAIAQAAQFYTAGFDTVSSTMSFTFYELCIHPEIQNRLRSEIKDNLMEHRKLSYESIQDMRYLDMVVCEILRKYPVLPFLDRLCLEDYKIPNSGFVIEKGTPVYIPVFALHYDPEYFPNPERFDPERFSNENKQNIPSFSYIPFGDGPRSCIGERLGLMVTKLGICSVLSQFEVVRCAETPVPVVLSKLGFLTAAKHGLPMKFHKSPIN